MDNKEYPSFGRWLWRGIRLVFTKRFALSIFGEGVIGLMIIMLLVGVVATTIAEFWVVSLAFLVIPLLLHISYRESKEEANKKANANDD